MNFHNIVDIYSKFLLRGRLSRAVTCARIHFGKVLNGVLNRKIVKSSVNGLLRELLNIPSNVRLFSPSVLLNSYK